MGAADHRTPSAGGGSAAATRLPPDRGGRMRGCVHGPARRQHRHPRLSCARALVPLRCGSCQLGGSQLSRGAGGNRRRRGPLGRHGGPQAALHLRVHHLHRRLGAVRQRLESPRFGRVPCSPGRGRGHAAGQQCRHHRPGRAPGPVGPGPWGAGCRPGPGPGAGPFGRRVVAGRRRVAPPVPRQRARRIDRNGDGAVVHPEEHPPPNSRPIRLARVRSAVPGRRRPVVRGVRRAPTRAGTHRLS